MKWTTERPTKPGHFLMRYPNDRPTLVNIFYNEKRNKDGKFGFQLRIMDGHHYVGALGNICEGDCLWFGPIEELIKEPQP